MNKEHIENRIAKLKANQPENAKIIKKWERMFRNLEKNNA